MGHWTKCGNTKQSQNIQLWKFDHLAIWIRCWWHPSILTHLKQINKALGQWEGNDSLTETIMPVSKAMMVNPWATILPRIIFCNMKVHKPSSLQGICFNVNMCYLLLIWVYLTSFAVFPSKLEEAIHQEESSCSTTWDSIYIILNLFNLSHQWGETGSPWISWQASQRAPPGAFCLCLCLLPTLCSTGEWGL